MIRKQLLIESLYIKNFKSYKGEYTIKPFNKRLTCIIGPNGSGKSNIIDAILFVLGYKAKKLRNINVKELVNSDCESCTVILEFNYLSIKRTVNKLSATGTSKYFIKLEGEKDFRGAQISEISKIVKNEYNIDLDHNRFLILQGEIESIALLSPIDLLAYIEDCIGTSVYVGEIESIKESYSNAIGDLRLYKDKGKFIENEYDFIKTKMEGKVDILRMKEVYLRNLLYSLKLEGKKTVEVENTLHSELESKQEEHCLLENEHDSLDKEIKKMSVVRKDLKLEENYFKQKAEHGRIIRGNEEIKKRKLLIKEKIENSKQIIANEDKRLKEKNILENELKEITEDLNTQNNLLSDIGKNPELKMYEKEKLILEKKVYEISEKQNRTNNVCMGIEEIKRRIAQLNEEVRIFQNKRKFPVKEGEIEQISKDILSTKREIEIRKRNMAENKYIEIQYKKDREVDNHLKNTRGYLGRLKTLGNIQEGYEMAVEAACPSLNNIVVETAEAAEEMIKIINKKGLQRTAFIILNKIGKSFSNEKSPLLLYQKINCKAEYISAFHFGLGDTLVANDMEEAKELAFGSVRRRVVTIDGKLLEKSGIMSGGGRVKKVKSTIELEGLLEDMEKLLKEKTKEKASNFNIEERIVKIKSELNLSKNKLEILLKSDQSDYSRELNIAKEKLSKLTENATLVIDEKIKEKAKIEEIINILDNKNYQLKKRLLELNSKEETNYCLDVLEDEYKKCILTSIDENAFFQIEAQYNEMILKYNKEIESNDKLKGKRQLLYERIIQSKYKMDEIKISFRNNKDTKHSIKKKAKKAKNEIFIIQEFIRKLPETELSKKISEFSSALNNSKNSIHLNPIDEEIEKGENGYNNEENVELIEKSLSEIQKNIGDLKISFKEMLFEKYNIGDDEIYSNLNDEIVAHYNSVFNDYIAIKNKFEKYLNGVKGKEENTEALKESLGELKTKRLKEFLEGFSLINANLKNIFSLITCGGNAELDLVNYLDPFSDGILLNILPPKKAWKVISNLSGGEKTLSSLSLIFALHKFKPSSFYIMDEIDAALDYRNVSIISNYISTISSQFVIISLRNNMFERANSLIGVYKNNDISKFIVCDIKELIS